MKEEPRRPTEENGAAQGLAAPGAGGTQGQNSEQAPSTGAGNVAGSYGVEAMAAERSGAVKETQPLLEHALHGREGEKSLLLPASCPPSTCHRFPLAGPGRKRAGERDGKGLAGGGKDAAENRPPRPAPPRRFSHWAAFPQPPSLSPRSLGTGHWSSAGKSDAPSNSQ